MSNNIFYSKEMIAQTDGGMVEVFKNKPDGEFVEIPKDCYPPKFMNEYALDSGYGTKVIDFVFWDRHNIVTEEHLRV